MGWLSGDCRSRYRSIDSSAQPSAEDAELIGQTILTFASGSTEVVRGIDEPLFEDHRQAPDGPRSRATEDGAADVEHVGFGHAEQHHDVHDRC